MDDRLLSVAPQMLWQVSCITGVLFLVAMVVRHRFPHVMYALCLLALLKCILPPLWESPLGLFRSPMSNVSEPTASEHLSVQRSAVDVANPIPNAAVELGDFS